MENKELKELLEKNLEVSKESLSLLKKIRRDNFYQRIFVAIKWLVIIFLLVWGFIQLQPILDQALSVWENIQDIPSGLGDLPKF